MVAEEKVLLDTDIGSDIDDAVCLAYLLAQPACDLQGITTVSGQAARRAELASALCRVAGRDVPIYPGIERPLLTDLKQAEAPQAEALGSRDRQTDFPTGEAIGFLRDTIRKHPGEVTLLTVGPLTNAAVLFAADPEIPGLLKRLVMMCGCFTGAMRQTRPTEWNASCDPHATAIVYRHPVRVHRAVGLDVTTQVRMDAKDVRDRFRHPLLQPVLEFAEVWFRNVDSITFHDPLAAVTLFDETVCAFERGTVTVETGDNGPPGATHWQQGPGKHEIAVAVDPDRFFKRYFEVLESD